MHGRAGCGLPVLFLCADATEMVVFDVYLVLYRPMVSLKDALILPV